MFKFDRVASRGACAGGWMFGIREGLGGLEFLRKTEQRGDLYPCPHVPFAHVRR